VTIFGLEFGTLLSGAVITETVFAWPGVGRLIILAVQQRDFPVVVGAVTIIATLFVFLNLIVDLLYGVIDPRVRYS
jgi:ABC-type dipeptide/oligopeptide/nickel transport system permease component